MKRRAYFFSFLAGLISSVSLFFIYIFSNYWWIGIILVVWFASILLLYLFSSKEKLFNWKELALILTTCVAFLAVLSLIEIKPLLYFLIVFVGILVASLFRWKAAQTDTQISHTQKPFRRIEMMVWVFNAYAIQTAFFALSLFFHSFPFWAIVILSTCFFGFISLMIWRLYYPGTVKAYLNRIMFISIIVGELIWVVGLLPFGYAVSGLLVTWLWYIVHLFLRFHFSPQGVIWKKQKWFLGINFVIMLLFFIFVFRWI